MKHLTRITLVLFVLVLALYLGVRIYSRGALDTTPPTLTFDSDTLELSVSDPQTALLAGVTARDDRDGDLTDQVLVQGVGQLLANNTARVSYVVFDQAGNLSTASRYICYTDYEKPRFTLSQPLIFPVDLAADLPDLSGLVTASCVLDGDLSDQIRITAHSLNAYQPGEYDITFQVANSMNDVQVLRTKVVIDDQAAAWQPVKLRQYLLYLPQGSTFQARDSILSVSGGDAGDVVISGDVDTQTPGSYCVRYCYTTGGHDYVVYLTVVVY